jgi:hypothetical protein
MPLLLKVRSYLLVNSFTCCSIPVQGTNRVYLCKFSLVPEDKLILQATQDRGCQPYAQGHIPAPGRVCRCPREFESIHNNLLSSRAGVLKST